MRFQSTRRWQDKQHTAESEALSDQGQAQVPGTRSRVLALLRAAPRILCHGFDDCAPRSVALLIPAHLNQWLGSASLSPPRSVSSLARCGPVFAGLASSSELKHESELSFMGQSELKGLQTPQC